MPRPIVLVHGNGMGGWSWRKVARRLRAAGHEVYAPSLTGTGDRWHLAGPQVTLDTLGRDVAGVIEYEDLRDVVLVATSGGGMAAARAAELVPDRIGSLILIDALIPVTGEAAVDLVKQDWEGLRDRERDGVPLATASVDRLRAQLSREDAEWATPRLTTFPYRAMAEPVGLERFWQGGWPATVVFCQRTVNPPEPIQRRTAETLKAEWLHLDSGHNPFFTHPDELSKIILDRAG